MATVLSGAQVSPSGEPGPVGAMQPTIWSVRQRSFNAILNPNFEIDQNLVGNTQANTQAGYTCTDRYMTYMGPGAMRFSTQQVSALTDPIAFVPGTNFRITSNFLRLTLTTQQASLAANDYFMVMQNIEGIRFRELAGGTHSISVLVRSSVPSVKFCVSINDNNNSSITQSLVKLCTTSATANTPTLITLPGLPVWPSGNFSMSLGNYGYRIQIALCGGANYIAPAEGVWQSGNLLAVAGMGNFAANAVNSTFDIAFIQHEPGPDCSSLIDIPFVENLDDCQRYYQKSFPYTIVPGLPYNYGFVCLGPLPTGWQSAMVGIQFRKEMVVGPSVNYFNPVSGAGPQARGWPSGYNYSVSSIASSAVGTYSMTLSPATPQIDVIQFHYQAYTNW